MPSVEKRLRWNDVIPIFIQERLQAKLDKLKPDENAQRAELIAQHQRDTWLQNAAKRVQQIQAVTHSLKPIHPDARGTNLYVQPATLAPLAELGSHALGAKLMPDVVGNAAALDVYKLLKLEVAGVNLLAALQTSQPDALQALSTDPQQAQALRDAFVGLTLAREGGASSHVRAKQLYWLVGSDPCDDAAYHLLAPLYATSLAHAVYAPLQEARFGEANKAARAARRERKAHDGVFHDYPGLAVQKMGGQAAQAKAKYSFATEQLKAEADVLRFAAGLERGAVSAYLGAVPLFADRKLAQVAASILGDEAMHWAVLRQALGEAPVPSAFMS